MKTYPFAIAAAAGALVIGGVLLNKATVDKGTTPPKVATAKPIPARPSDHLKEPELATFVSEHAASKDAKVQDEVGRARLRLAFMATHRKDYAAARKQLQVASREYKGTGVMDADYGGIPDQAAYQSAVCLVAEGKKDEARREFLRFMRERSLSPLVQAASVRLDRLNGMKPDEEGHKLLQAAIAKQEKRIRFETSVCGPKAIAYFLPLVGKPTRDYKELAKLCGTNDQGTTIEGMRKALLDCGVQVFGAEVNRTDLDKVQVPFLVLEADHYLVVTDRSANALKVYDPRDSSERRSSLPPLTDAKFSMTVLCTSVPALNEGQP